MTPEAPRRALAPPFVLLAVLAGLAALPAASGQTPEEALAGYAYVGVATGHEEIAAFCWSVGNESIFDPASTECWSNTKTDVVSAPWITAAEIIVGLVVGEHEVCVMVYAYGVQQCTLCRHEGEEPHCIIDPSREGSVRLLP